MAGKNKRVAVIGAGLGGLSAAISLAQKGYSVVIYEKNNRIGGKLNELELSGYRFDLGPSILTLPHFFERLFLSSGKNMRDYFSIEPVRPHWRNFFEDGTVIDLYPEANLMAKQAMKIGEEPEALKAFLEYAASLYELVNDGYFQAGLDTAQDFRTHYGIFNFGKFDLLRTMHAGVKKRLKTPYFRDIFDFFIKYVGSSAYDAPAFMNCLPAIQFQYDLWYVKGGLYNIARGFERFLSELGITVHLESQVTKIETADNLVTGLCINGITHVGADIVVSNMEVIPTYRELLNADPTTLRKLKRFAPACSGLVIDLGLDCTYDQLAHHNFFFSNNQKAHFDAVFHKNVLPEDPTLYVVDASKTDPSVAPFGGQCLKVLPHIPPINLEHPLEANDYVELRNRVLEKLERMGLDDLNNHIVVEHVLTPPDIERMYRSNQGSIYGVVCDRFKNFGFKAPKHSATHDNLFFVGGSVNPGGGMPMVVLCGQNVARAIEEWDHC